MTKSNQTSISEIEIEMETSGIGLDLSLKIFSKMEIHRSRCIIYEKWLTIKILLKWLNPTLDGWGGYIVPPPSILCSGALNIDLRGPRFWYNSYFIVTM